MDAHGSTVTIGFESSSNVTINEADRSKTRNKRLIERRRANRGLARIANLQRQIFLYQGESTAAASLPIFC